MIDLSGIEPLAIVVTSILAPLVVKGTEAFVEKAGERIADKTIEKMNKLYSIIKTKFANDISSKKMFENFETNPEEYSNIIANELEHKFSYDLQFQYEVANIVRDLKNGVNIRICLEGLEQDKIIGQNVRSIKGGNIDISIKNAKGKEIIGQNVDTIGD